MLGKKHSMIKLFGKTIQLGSNLSGDMSISERTEPCFAVIADCDDLSTSSKQSMNRGYEESSTTEPIITNQEEEKSSSTQTSPYATLSKNPPKNPSNDKDKISQHLSQNEDHTDQTTSTTTTHSQDQNPPKKPLKTQPCPRCCSMSTKFCYFNNYNVNQPRHFCKNCQRYWTAGGAIRNVPVGAGRRKSKKTSAFHHHRDHPQLKPNGIDSLDSESLALSLKLMQKQQSYTPNGFHLLEFTRAKNSGFLMSSPALGKHPRDETQLESSITCYEELSEQRKTEILGGVLCSEWDNNVMSNKLGSSNWRKGFFGGLHHLKCPDHGDQYKNSSSAHGSSVILQANRASLYKSLSLYEIAQLGC